MGGEYNGIFREPQWVYSRLYKMGSVEGFNEPQSHAVYSAAKPFSHDKMQWSS